MKLNDFIKKGLVKKSEKDKSLAKSLIKTSTKDLQFLNTIKINENSARKVISNYYDCLRSIIEAIAVLEGIKSYSHEAFTYYLKENKREDLLAEKFDRFRKIRNGIEYYGKEISIEEAKEYKKDVLNIIDSLKEKYLKEVDHE